MIAQALACQGVSARSLSLGSSVLTFTSYSAAAAAAPGRHTAGPQIRDRFCRKVIAIMGKNPAARPGWTRSIGTLFVAWVSG